MAVWVFGVWAAACAAFLLVGAFTLPEPAQRAIFGMGLGLAVIWIGLGGAVMLGLRRRVAAGLSRLAHRPRLAFVVAATTLALVEEAITTTMTNLAPLWGVSPVQAHITSSTNYLEVVLRHSVIVFVPMFAVWAWLLGRYAFSPGAVFLLFGLTGVLAEAASSGVNPIQVGFWVYVYGLMVYLPAYVFAAPASQTGATSRRRPRLLATLAAVVLPLLAAVPVALIVLSLPIPAHDL